MRTSVAFLSAVFCYLVFCTAGLACSIDEFSEVSRDFPSFNSELTQWFSTAEGQSAELRVYKWDGAIVSMTAEYFTDDSSVLKRLVRGGPSGDLFITEFPSEDGTRYEFALCPDGSIVPTHSATKMLNDSEFEAMAKSVVNDFFVNPKIAPFTKQFVK